MKNQKKQQVGQKKLYLYGNERSCSSSSIQLRDGPRKLFEDGLVVKGLGYLNDFFFNLLFDSFVSFIAIGQDADHILMNVEPISFLLLSHLSLPNSSELWIGVFLVLCLHQQLIQNQSILNKLNFDFMLIKKNLWKKRQISLKKMDFEIFYIRRFYNKSINISFSMMQDFESNSSSNIDVTQSSKDKLQKKKQTAKFIVNLIYENSPILKKQLQQKYFASRGLSQEQDEKIKKNVLRRFNEVVNVLQGNRMIQLKGKLISLVKKSQPQKEQERIEVEQQSQLIQHRLLAKQQQLQGLKEKEIYLKKLFIKNRQIRQSNRIKFPALVLTIDENDYVSLANIPRTHTQSHSIAIKGVFQDCQDIESLLKYIELPNQKEELGLGEGK